MDTNHENENTQKDVDDRLGVPPQSHDGDRSCREGVNDARKLASGLDCQGSTASAGISSESIDEGVNQNGALGIPEQVATNSTLIPMADSLIEKRTWGDVSEGDFLQENGRLVGVERILKWKSGKYIAVVLGACVVLIFSSQALSLINQIESLAPWARYLALAGLGFLIVAFGWASVQLVRSYMRFEKTPELLMKELAELSERARVRRIVNVAIEDARDKLEGYLRRYPGEVEDARDLAAIGVAQEEIEQLVSARRDLLEGQGAQAGSEGWIDDFKTRFVEAIDQCANRVVEQYAKKVGLKTAIAPTGFVDTLVVLTNAYLMLRDLFVLYNVRLSRTGTFAVLFRVLLNAFAASQMEDLAEEVAGGFTRWLKDTVSKGNPSVGLPGADVVGAAATAVVSRVAEGTANYLLFRRLGKAVIRHLRPV